MTAGASIPEDKIEEVTLMFKMFDRDGDGKVTIAELKRVLQTLDKSLWTEEKLARILESYDSSQDGELQLTEFWGWVCGHGGKDVQDFEPTLAAKARAEHEEQCRINEEKAAKARGKREAREAKEAIAAKKQQERLEGRRMSRDAFIKEQMSAGVTKEVAQQLLNEADVDHDGEVDAQEWQWVANERTATLSQIRGLYQKGVGSVDPKGNLIVKEVNSQGMTAIVEAFTNWDKDGSGTISIEELMQVLHVLNPRLGEKTAETLRKEIDVNQDGVIDILEFVGWLSGENTKKKKMKKKAQDEQKAMVALALHKKRAQEAKKLGLQAEFETAQHKNLEGFIKQKKFSNVCHTLMTGPGAPQMCKGCYGRHAWVCHNCGFLSYFEECVNGCSQLEAGWTCITGKAAKKKDGSKKPVSFWQKNGSTSDVLRLSLDVHRLIDAGAEVLNDILKGDEAAATDAA